MREKLEEKQFFKRPSVNTRLLTNNYYLDLDMELGTWNLELGTWNLQLGTTGPHPFEPAAH